MSTDTKGVNAAVVAVVVSSSPVLLAWLVLARGMAVSEWEIPAFLTFLGIQLGTPLTLLSIVIGAIGLAAAPRRWQRALLIALMVVCGVARLWVMRLR